MSDKYIEKVFLYLLVLSVVLHLAIFKLITLIPPEKTGSKEPTMVDLTELPNLPAEPAPKSRPKPRPNLQAKPPEPKPVDRFADQRQRVAREKEQTPRATAPKPSTEARSLPGPEPMRSPLDRGEKEPVRRGDGIFKPRAAEVIDRSRLFPSAGKMARLEDNYRDRYSREVENGESKFMNTDDIQFGSFMRRLETAVYGVWHYPEAALMRGIEGTTPVRITFNRSGDIVRVELLETSGSALLDDEVLRTLKHLGPIGSLPRGYTGEYFKLIAFFHYGIGGSRLR
jgi:protein TonB